jgi:hypothetical protein
MMTLGKPTHFRISKNRTACGLIGTIELAAYDARDCNCIRCMKTKKYKVYMGTNK